MAWVEMPNPSSVDSTKRPFSSSPTAPTASAFMPSLAQSTTVPPAVPATVSLISSMKLALPPSGIDVMGRPSTSMQ